MSTTIPALHLDELRDRAVRSPEELTPGSEVLFAHVPDLDELWLRTSRDSGYAHTGTIVEVAPRHHHELRAGRNPLPDAQPRLAIIYRRSDTGERDYIYAADTGVTPYGEPGSEFYNPTNFAVLLAPLEAEGIVPLLTASEEFAEELQHHSSQISFADSGGYFSHRYRRFGS